MSKFWQSFEDHFAEHLAKYIVGGLALLVWLGFSNKADINEVKADVKNAVPRLIYDVNISELKQANQYNQEQIRRLQDLWDRKYSTNSTRGNPSVHGSNK
jgi:hypothetical protein